MNVECLHIGHQVQLAISVAENKFKNLISQGNRTNKLKSRTDLSLIVLTKNASFED